MKDRSLKKSELLFNHQSPIINRQSPRIGACGDNCDECLRFIATKKGSDAELHKVAQLWFDLSLRDRIISTEEIRCNGCSPENKCAYREQRDCAFQRSFQNCGYCPDYPCLIVENTLSISDDMHQKTEDLSGSESIIKAFFKKKENLDKVRLTLWEGVLVSNHDIHIVQLDYLQIGDIKTLWETLNSYHLAKSIHFKDHFSAFTFDARIIKLQKKENLAIFMALCGSQKCGYSIASVYDDMGEVDSLFVIEAQRGNKLGQVLFLKAVDWLKDQGCNLINVAIADGNEHVVSFYERFGFKKRFTVVQKIVI
jgi:diamine N-acetyltransferase